MYTGNIIFFSFCDDIVITKKDVIEMSDTTFNFVGSTPYFTVVMPGYRNDVSKEAREFDFYKELGRKPACIAEAVIVKDLPTRIVVDFYYKFRRFPYPTKVFSRQEKVYAWFGHFDLLP